MREAKIIRGMRSERCRSGSWQARTAGASLLRCNVRGPSTMPSVPDSLVAAAGAFRDGHRTGATGVPLRTVVHIGIGGSDLGPRLVCDALPAGPDAIDVAFVSNVDPEHLTRALSGRDPATTLFVVVSKTFTTQE